MPATQVVEVRGELTEALQLRWQLDTFTERANDTEYGLAAYFYTRDLDRAIRVSAALKTGMVGVNRSIISDVAAPFGGVKESGFGREGGTEGIAEYFEVKYIAL